MKLELVKSATGRRLRHPKTKAVLPNIDDPKAIAISVDLHDAHWHRAFMNGDIVVVKTPAAIPAPAAPAPAPVTPPIAPSPVIAEPLAPAASKNA